MTFELKLHVEGEPPVGAGDDFAVDSMEFTYTGKVPPRVLRSVLCAALAQLEEDA